MMHFFLTTMAISLASMNVVAQKTTKYELAKVLRDKKFEIYNRHASLVEDGNRKGITLDEGSGEGVLWVKGSEFKSGTIEVDLRGRNVMQRSFIGIAFHSANDTTYDAIYFRPFNFHSADSIRKIHAVQYISHPVYTWKKLRDERNGIYEKAVVPAPGPDGWFHVRIEVIENTVKVYVDNAATPSLTVEKMSEHNTGEVGLWVGDGSNGDFANLQITSR